VAAHARFNARYSDDIWPLKPLTANPSKRSASIHWASCPEEFRGQLRLAAWNLINGKLQPTFLAVRPAMRSRISADHTEDTVRSWISLARWLRSRGITTLADCTTAVLHAWGQHLNDRGLSRGRVEKALASVTRLWAFDQLSARPAGIGRPPWDESGTRDYLPEHAKGRGENSTEPLEEQTIAALLIWAMRLVEDFADDIIAAFTEARRLTAAAAATRATQAGQAPLEAYLHPLIQGGSPVPARRMRGRWMASRTYICAMTGASGHQFDAFAAQHDLTGLAARRPGSSPLAVPVTGQVNGRPWRTASDFTEAADLMRHLGTAAFVVAAYLTGMRVSEVLGLRSGCCPTRTLKRPDGTSSAAGNTRPPPTMTATTIRPASSVTCPGSPSARSLPPSGSWNGSPVPANCCSATTSTM
jgi:hypothetical protein